MKKKIKEVSKNERAGAVCGFRSKGTPLVFPVELGYQCPKNKKHFLEWSEYNNFIWCQQCNYDYLSPLCKKDPRDATKIYLDVIEEIKSQKK